MTAKPQPRASVGKSVCIYLSDRKLPYLFIMTNNWSSLHSTSQTLTMKILAKFCLLLVSYLVTLTGVEGDTTS